MADPKFRNLIPGQIQIGNLIAGTGTNVFIENFDVKPYDVNNQDYQIPRTDEKRFGFDQLAPTTIEFQFNVLNNWLLPEFEGTIPNFWAEMSKVSDLAREWRFDEGRYLWGSMKALFVCGDDGVSKVIYGRPGQFGSQKTTTKSLWTPCIAEFRRADTLAYSVYEYGIGLNSDTDPDYLERTDGDTETWFRLIIVGPMTNPVITVGEHEIALNYELEENEIVEISSYPWQRRIVNNERVNLADRMVGSTLYLDRLRLPVGQEIALRWTSDEFNTWVPALGNESWAEDIGGFFEWALPSSFVQKAGRAVVRFDLLNISGPKKFIGNGILGETSSILYDGKKYNTEAQYSEAIITEPFWGRSAMAIMCDEDMTSGMAVEVVSGIGNNKLRLRTVTSPTTLGSVIGEWTNPSILGWNETDKVSIEYDEDEEEYIVKLNGETKISEASAIPRTADYRWQAFIFDLDGDLLTLGTGFRNILAYDKAGSLGGGFPGYENPSLDELLPSSVTLLWRDAWSSI